MDPGFFYWYLQFLDVFFMDPDFPDRVRIFGWSGSGLRKKVRSGSASGNKSGSESLGKIPYCEITFLTVHLNFLHVWDSHLLLSYYVDPDLHLVADPNPTSWVGKPKNTINKNVCFNQCCGSGSGTGSGSVLDPYSGSLWIRIRIQNTDPDPHM